MLVSEFREFRAEVVDALDEHPEWRKTKRRPYDRVEHLTPRVPGARTYWRIRNGTKGLAQKYANFEEATAVCLGSSYDPQGDYELDPQDARLVLKWRQEFREIDRREENHGG